MPRSILRSLAGLSLLATLAVAATRPRYGGELRVEIEETLTESEPAAWPVNIASLAYDRLVRLDENGRAQPSLAISWEHDREWKRWQFRLRPGVKFHDGAALTPSAVAAILKTPYTASTSGETLLLESSTAAPMLLAELARSRNLVFHQTADGALAGTGPFRIAQRQAGRSMTLQANEDYWGGRPFLDSVDVQMGRAAREQSIDLELGKADLVEIAPSDARRAGQRGVRLWTSQPAELMALVFERGRPVVEDARLREAIALSIDRAAIHSVLLQKQGEPAAAILPQWLSGYAFLFNSAPDRERSRRLAASAAKPGDRYTLSYPPADSLARAMAERIAVNAREAGITLQVAPRPGADMRIERLRLDSTDPAAALLAAASALGFTEALDLPMPALPERVYAAERRLLESFRVVPIAHLPQIYGLAPRVRVWPGFRRDELRPEDLWLAAENIKP